MTHALVSLRIPDWEDYVALYAQRFEQQVMHWADEVDEVPTIAAYVYRRMERQSLDNYVERIIDLEGPGPAPRRPIGTISACGVDRQRGEGTLSVVIVDPTCWGKGYGSEALTLFLQLLSREGLRRIHLETFADNKRAQAAFRKAGFRPTHCFHEPSIDRHIVLMVCDLSPEQPAAPPPPPASICSPGSNLILDLETLAPTPARKHPAH